MRKKRTMVHSMHTWASIPPMKNGKPYKDTIEEARKKELKEERMKKAREGI